MRLHPVAHRLPGKAKPPGNLAIGLPGPDQPERLRLNSSV